MAPLANRTIATVGSGVMAEAMIAGLLRGKLVKPAQVVASHPRQERREHLAREYGIRTVASNIEAVEGADVILFGIKPQMLGKVGREIGPHLRRGQLVLSVLAGATRVACHAGPSPNSTPTASAVIPAGQPSVSFPVTVLDNNVADGAHSVVLGGSVRETGSGQIVGELIPAVLDVTDDEGPTLTLAFDLEAVGGDAGVLLAALEKCPHRLFNLHYQRHRLHVDSYPPAGHDQAVTTRATAIVEDGMCGSAASRSRSRRPIRSIWRSMTATGACSSTTRSRTACWRSTCCPTATSTVRRLGSSLRESARCESPDWPPIPEPAPSSCSTA
jgi:hypothetical protein